MRDFNAQGDVETLHLECYVEMAERVLNDLGAEARRRFDLKSWQIVHRFGSLSSETPIVFVATSADHRAEAFSACEFVMDTLKTDAPFGSEKIPRVMDNGLQWLHEILTADGGGILRIRFHEVLLQLRRPSRAENT